MSLRARSIAFRIALGTSVALPMAAPTPALAVTDDHNRAKLKRAPALHHLRNAVNLDHVLDEFRIFFLGFATALFPVCCHDQYSRECS